MFIIITTTCKLLFFLFELSFCRPKPPTQVRSSFGITRPIASPSHPLPSPQQQQSSANVKLKKDREKRKLLIPFHQRHSVEKDVPKAFRTHVAMATKGVPTVNLLTSVNQKRHVNVAAASAGAMLRTKKQSWPNQSSSAKNVRTMSRQQLDSTSNSDSHITNLSSNVNSLIRDDDVFIDTALSNKNLSNSIQLKPVGENLATETDCNEVENLKLQGKAKDCKTQYVLPVLGTFHLPTLPDDPLDCRTTDLLLPKPLEEPLESFRDQKPSMWEL